MFLFHLSSLVYHQCYPSRTPVIIIILGHRRGMVVCTDGDREVEPKRNPQVKSLTSLIHAEGSNQMQSFIVFN